MVETEQPPTARQVKNEEEEGEQANEVVLVGENTGDTANAKGPKKVSKNGHMARAGEKIVKYSG